MSRGKRRWPRFGFAIHRVLSACVRVGEVNIQDPSTLVLFKSTALPDQQTLQAKQSRKATWPVASELGYKWLDIMTHHYVVSDIRQL